MKIDLSWIRRKTTSDDAEALRNKLDAIAKIIDDAMDTVHHVSSELRPRISDDLGLAEALAWQEEEFQRRTGISCNVTIEDDDLDLQQDQATAVFRIF